MSVLSLCIPKWFPTLKLLFPFKLSVLKTQAHEYNQLYIHFSFPTSLWARDRIYISKKLIPTSNRKNKLKTNPIDFPQSFPLVINFTSQKAWRVISPKWVWLSWRLWVSTYPHHEIGCYSMSRKNVYKKLQ